MRIAHRSRPSIPPRSAFAGFRFPPDVIGLGSEVEGVEVDPGGAHPQGGPADGVGELLAADVWGIGFKTADQLARGLGIPHDSPQRVKAGLQFALSQAAEDGQ